MQLKKIHETIRMILKKELKELDQNNYILCDHTLQKF